MIAKDFQPLSIVEDVGFKNFVYKLNSNYTLPNRKKLSETIIPNIYENLKKNLQDTLLIVNYVSLTTDYWQSQTTKSYLSLTAHYISDYCLKSSVIETREVQVSHTALNTANTLRDILNE